MRIGGNAEVQEEDSMQSKTKRAPGSEERRARRSRVAGLALALAVALVWSAPPASAYEDEFGDEDQWQEWIDGGYRDPFNFREDIVAAVPLANSEQFFIVGEFGLFGLLDLEDQNGEVQIIETEWKDDLVSAVALQDGTALAGSATGAIFRYADGTVERAAVIHDAHDSVLGLGVERDAAGNDVAVWAGGARGLLKKSTDGGSSWSDVAPASVTQPPIPMDHPGAGRRFIGVGNIDEESFVLDARVNGRPAKRGSPDEGGDYEITFEDGVLEVWNDFDAEPVPTLAFDFAPGPPFQAGDFTMSTVVTQGTTITMAGEFGLVLQTTDSGASWVRLDGQIFSGDPIQPYWIGGVQRGDTIILVGAAGFIRRSDDGGQTWSTLARPAEENGVFGVHLSDGGDLTVAGAVGMLADYNGGDSWKFADRSGLSVYSWLKTLILRDGKLLALGGRGNCVYRQSGDWERCRMRIVANEG